MSYDFCKQPTATATWKDLARLNGKTKREGTPEFNTSPPGVVFDVFDHITQENNRWEGP